MSASYGLYKRASSGNAAAGYIRANVQGGAVRQFPLKLGFGPRWLLAHPTNAGHGKPGSARMATGSSSQLGRVVSQHIATRSERPPIKLSCISATTERAVTPHIFESVL